MSLLKSAQRHLVVEWQTEHQSNDLNKMEIVYSPSVCLVNNKLEKLIAFIIY
jgi:hypothetical protein